MGPDGTSADGDAAREPVRHIQRIQPRTSLLRISREIEERSRVDEKENGPAKHNHAQFGEEALLPNDKICKSKRQRAGKK